MSTWLCSDRHFAFVAKLAEIHGLTSDRDALAVALKLENHRSLNYRYGDDIPGEVTIEADIADQAGHIEDAGWCIRQVACLDYQSCEHPGWEQSDAFAVMTRLYEALGGDPVNDSARGRPDIPWGVD